jgi:hypothetical protein
MEPGDYQVAPLNKILHFEVEGINRGGRTINRDVRVARTGHGLPLIYSYTAEVGFLRV